MMGREQKSKKIGRIMNTISSEVAPEILSLILSKLSFLNLLNCRLVCKDWNTSVSSFKFDANIFLVKKSLDHLHYVDFDTKRLIGMNTVASFKLHPKWSISQIANSCNGLLCILLGGRTECVAIINPMTNEYVDVIPKGDRDRIYSYGLGFSPKTKQYKLVRHSFIISETLVEIFGFGGTGTSTSQWRSIYSVSSRMKFILHFPCVYFNGALYWLGEDCGVPHPLRRNVMWRMNVEDEKFEEIWCLPDEAYCSFNFAVCMGSLYLSHYKTRGFEYQKVEYHVWKMDERGLWNREFVVGMPQTFPSHWMQTIKYHYFQLMKICEDGKFLYRFGRIDLVLYDPKTSKFEKLDHKEGITSYMFMHQMSSLDFRPHLHNILAGDVA